MGSSSPGLLLLLMSNRSGKFSLLLAEGLRLLPEGIAREIVQSGRDFADPGSLGCNLLLEPVELRLELFWFSLRSEVFEGRSELPDPELKFLAPLLEVIELLLLRNTEPAKE
ncbi:MAG: hypothetical protein GX885_10930 [Methanomicrobiales archaeon]|nr:hypothetical protein [Methanomicrobiales archaeon]